MSTFIYAIGWERDSSLVLSSRVWNCKNRKSAWYVYQKSCQAWNGLYVLFSLVILYLVISSFMHSWKWWAWTWTLPCWKHSWWERRRQAGLHKGEHKKDPTGKGRMEGDRAIQTSRVWGHTNTHINSRLLLHVRSGQTVSISNDRHRCSIEEVKKMHGIWNVQIVIAWADER